MKHVEIFPNFDLFPPKSFHETLEKYRSNYTNSKFNTPTLKEAKIMPENKPEYNLISTPETRYIVDYAQLYAKTHNGVPVRPLKIGRESKTFGFLPACSMGFVRGACSSGHQFAKLLLCGREWCPDCGQDMSMAHKRRIARWWGKVMQMEKMGYLVVTIPNELRETFKDKKTLSDFKKYIKRKLQRMGYKRGLMRYHWAGEDGKKWHPHLNILIEQNYFSKKELKLLKDDLQKWFEKKFSLSLNGLKAKVNAWYNYANNSNQEAFVKAKIHKLKYITRATMKFFDPEIAKILKGFRATSTWGKWDKKIEAASPIVKLTNGVCAHEDCKQPIKWQGGRDNVYSRKSCSDFKVILKPLDGGYYEIMGKLPDKPPPADFAINKNYLNGAMLKHSEVYENIDKRTDNEKESDLIKTQEANRHWKAQTLAESAKKAISSFFVNN